MKVLKKWTLLIGGLLCLGLFSSCDNNDTHEAMVLSGQWRGDFGMYYDYVDSYGRSYTFDSYDTDIVFYPEYDYATHGWGKQVDWYDYVHTNTSTITSIGAFAMGSSTCAIPMLPS